MDAKKLTLEYPPAREADQTDDFFGTRIRDPYRWLEDPDSEESRRWIEAQNALTFDRLGHISVREELRGRIRELWDFERYSAPERKGSRYFFQKNDGLQNQPVLYALDKLDGTPRVLLDPNQLTKGGTIALSGGEITEDGSLMAYALSSGGSDWMEWRVKKVDSGEDLPDHLLWSKFSNASWTLDNKGFFYARYPEPSKSAAALEEANYYQKLYYHRLGTAQSEDALILEDKEHKERGFNGLVTEDGKYLVITVWEGTDRRNRVYYRAENKKKSGPIVKLLDEFDASYGFVGNKGPIFYMQTDFQAPRGKLVAIDTRKPAKKDWKVVIPEGSDKLESVSMIGGGFLAIWLHNAQTVVSFHDLSGKKVRDIALPGIGTAGGFSGKAKDTETFYTFISFNYPPTIFRLDLVTGASTVFRAPKVKFNPEDYRTDQLVYRSKDNTAIPMFLVYKKSASGGLPRNGENAAYLYGYGGFNVSLTPTFSTSLIAWLDKGGVYAQPSLRGGGELGEDWHQAGMLDKKQNVFDDFASAAEYLISEKVTRPDKLAIGGGSNGGLLVGASITQHPELFGAAILQVGVLDMLRFHKFTIGHAWVSEYGSADDRRQFETLIKYSPLHNLKMGTHYPATLIMTGDHDDRVVPAHSFKFGAALQKAQGGVAPILVRIETKAGHGAGKPTMKLIDEAADRWAFLFEALAIKR